MELMHTYRKLLYYPDALARAIKAHTLTNGQIDALQTARRGFVVALLSCATPAGRANFSRHMSRRTTLHRSMIEALRAEDLTIAPALNSAKGRGAWHDMDIDRQLAEIDRAQKAGEFYMVDVQRVDRQASNRTNDGAWQARVGAMGNAFARSRGWRLFTARTWLAPA